MNSNLDFEVLFKQLPEPELWSLLQQVIDAEVELDDRSVSQLDDRMQGLLFLQEFVVNREARIRFAASAAHMTYLRDAAGSRNVWMDDEEFTALVEANDPVTLACFARSQEMRPHHLAFIEHKLRVDPHGVDLLATSWDTRITLKKALESQGNTREMDLFRLARKALEGSNCDPRELWRAYLDLSTRLPLRTSTAVADSIH